MNYCLVVLSSPYASDASGRAAKFARALLGRGHEIGQVFFYDEGTYGGLGTAICPQGEVSALQDWTNLQSDYALELVLCIGSAIKRGVLDGTEAERHEQAGATIHPAFILGGLGQLVDASSRCDRLVSFG
jgi:tRNA 2-thiouridine synthesizing protein D